MIGINKSISEVRANKAKKLFSFGLISMPILNQYGFISGSLGLGELFMIIVILACIPFLLRCETVTISKYWVYFLYSSISCTVISAITYQSIPSNTLMTIMQSFFYIFIFLLMGRYFLDFDFAFHMYKIFSSGLAIILCIQFLLYYTKGITTPWIFISPFFPLNYVSIGDYSNYSVFYNQVILVYSGFRPSSLFSEPTLYAQFVTPCIALTLFNKKNKREFWLAIFLTITVLFSKSGNGFLYIAIVWIYWIFSNVKKNSKVNTKLLFASLIGIFVIVLFWVSNPDQFWILTRLQEINSSTITSGNMRVVRGFYIYNRIDFVNQIFGIGDGNILRYLSDHLIHTPYDGGYLGYMSGLSYVLVNGGIVGGVLYFGILISKFKVLNKTGRSLFFILLFILVASSNFQSSAIYAVIWSFMEAMTMKQKQEVPRVVQAMSETGQYLFRRGKSVPKGELS